MSNGDKSTEARLAAIEALMQDRKENTQQRFDSVDAALGTLLANSKNVVTIDVLKDSFTAHITSCPSRNPSSPSPKSDDKNSGNKWADQVLKGYKGLGIVGTLLVLNAMLIVVVSKLIGVF